MTQMFAVLTGDLIGSRKRGSDAVDASMRALRAAAEKMGEQGSLIDYGPLFTRCRGDGWQIVLPSPKFVLLACLGLSAALRAAKTGLASRIAIGVGPVQSLGSQDLADASGEAFETSGALLDELARSHGCKTMMIRGAGITEWQQGIVALADWIAQGWTPQQAEAVAMVLLGVFHDTNEQRAMALGISRQAFEARLKGSGLAAMDIARDAFLQQDWGKP